MIMGCGVDSKSIKYYVRRQLEEKEVQLAKYKSSAFKLILKRLEARGIISISNSVDENNSKMVEISFVSNSIPPEKGDVTILLFYAYCPVTMTRGIPHYITACHT